MTNEPTGIEVRCPFHDGVTIFRDPDPSHPASHTFTREQAATLLYYMSFEDWEDGPRCLLNALASIEESYG